MFRHATGNVNDCDTGDNDIIASLWMCSGSLSLLIDSSREIGGIFWAQEHK